MRTLPPGWATDLAVLERTGSVIEDRGDHLVVRTPANPDFHWGHCLMVLDEDAVGDAPRWLETFRTTFPRASWVAIGLIRLPVDPSAWRRAGIDLELDDVLSTRTLPRQTPPAPGYTVRMLGDADWPQVTARAIAENLRTGEHEPEAFERFALARHASRAALCARGDAAFFGAFAGDELVADLGIVACGTTARYQDVGTAAAHRCHGLASHLLGVAARWAAEQGCDEWVILTEATNPAGRVYRAVGFVPGEGNAQAYRAPVRG